MHDALLIHRDSCVAHGSPLYGHLLDCLAADYRTGGLTYDLLSSRQARSVRDAIALRLLGGMHRLVLEGLAPELAAFYPSAGGTATEGSGPALLRTMAQHRNRLELDLENQVQTNEVGRAALLAAGFMEISRRLGLAMRQREIGASAGLLLNWDLYRYEPTGSTFGPTNSQVRFAENWWQSPAPDFDVPVVVTDRKGSDVSPIDATTDAGRLRLLSFVWPDQLARLERLRAAIDIAADTPPVVEKSDARAWLTRELATTVPGQVTVVHHSIVLQYIPQPGLAQLIETITSAGQRATVRAPLAWLRMEPAGPVADLRLTLWPGGREEVLATSGYHGQDVKWRG